MIEAFLIGVDGSEYPIKDREEARRLLTGKTRQAIVRKNDFTYYLFSNGDQSQPHNLTASQLCLRHIVGPAVLIRKN